MIILAGSTGFIGTEYRKYLDRNCVSYIIVDKYLLSNHSKLKEFLSYLTLIYKEKLYFINGTGFTGKPNVDACELNKTDCLYVNSVLPGIISGICQTLDIVYCHISSGCIYNGYDKIFTEKDEPNFTFRQNNCSFYSGTKALAEEIIKENKESYIWRLRIPFVSDLINPRSYLYKLIKYEKLLNTPNSITFVDDFVKITLEMIRLECPRGIYNIVNDEPVGAKEIIQILRKNNIINKNKKYFNNYKEFQETVIAPRSNCVLDNSKIKKMGFELENSYNILEEICKQYGN